MVAYHFFEDTPHELVLHLDHPLRGFDVMSVPLIDQSAHDERLKEFERHLLGKPALVEFEARADYDNRTAGVVHAFTEQVLAEPSLLSFQYIGQ